MSGSLNHSLTRFIKNTDSFSYCGYALFETTVIDEIEQKQVMRHFRNLSC